MCCGTLDHLPLRICVPKKKELAVERHETTIHLSFGEPRTPHAPQHSLSLQHSLTHKQTHATSSTLYNGINPLTNHFNKILFSSLPPFFFLSNFSLYISSSAIFFFMHAACYRCGSSSLFLHFRDLEAS